MTLKDEYISRLSALFRDYVEDESEAMRARAAGREDLLLESMIYYGVGFLEAMELRESLAVHERLANIGRGVMIAEGEIRNPLALINQATYAAEMDGRLNQEMIIVIRNNISKIESTLRELREKGEV